MDTCALWDHVCKPWWASLSTSAKWGSGRRWWQSLLKVQRLVILLFSTHECNDIVVYMLKKDLKLTRWQCAVINIFLP